MGSALPAVVAISLGTNDDPRNAGAFRSAIEQTLAVAGPGRCVVWATIQRPPVAGTAYTAFNTILRAEGRLHPNLRVVRWRRLARLSDVLSAHGYVWLLMAWTVMCAALASVQSHRRDPTDDGLRR